jgi:hypothetical protein
MNPIDRERFVEVVPATAPELADASFEAWLADAGLTRQEIGDENIRIDTIRALDGTSQRRYLVRGRVTSGHE